MTLQFADLPFDEMPFEENGCNKMGEVSIRRKRRFNHRLQGEIRGRVQKTPGSCTEERRQKATLDTFFLLSVEEMKDKERSISESFRMRPCEVNRGRDRGHWTRSACRGNVLYVEYVRVRQSINNGYRAVYSFRFAPLRHRAKQSNNRCPPRRNTGDRRGRKMSDESSTKKM